MSSRMTFVRARRRLSYAASALSIALAVAGCGGPGSGGDSAGGGRPGQSVSGEIFGGAPQNPISGASVQLYAAGGSGYGTGNTALGSAVTTGTDGSFTYGSYTCLTATTQTYFVASGGNSGGGVNSNIRLMSPIGPCGSIGNAFVNIDELTTVAGEWVLAQFSDSTGANIGTSSTNATGLDNALPTSASAAGLFGNLAAVDTSTFSVSGSASTFLTGNTLSPNYTATLPKFDTLANIIGACVNSGSPFTECEQLFCVATPGATWNGTACSIAPTIGDTLAAAHSIVTNPASNVSAIFGVQPPGSSQVFEPALSAPPNSWTLALNYTGGGLNGPDGIVVDVSGNVWVANNSGNNISEFNSLGSPLSPSSGYTGGGLATPEDIAIDASGNVWTENDTGNSMSKFSSSGSPLSPSSGYTGGGLSAPNGIAVDSSGNVWVSNTGPGNNSLSEFSSLGVALSPSKGYTGGGLATPDGIAIDASGNVWASNTSSGHNSLSEFSSLGVALSPSKGYTGGGLATPGGIAIDASGNVWASNNASGANSVSEFNSSGSPLSPSGGYTGGGLATPDGIAVDASGNVWVANNSGNSVSEFNSSGGAISTGSGYTGGGLNRPKDIAIDASGNVWVANNSGNSVSEFIGTAGPVMTPLGPGGPVKP